MPFNFSGVTKSILGGFNNKSVALVFGNSLSLIIVLLLIIIMFLFIFTTKSTQKNKWKHFLVFVLISILLVTSAVFLHEHFRKNNIAQLFGSAEKSNKYEMPPDVFFDMKKPAQENVGVNVFDELFMNT